MIRTLRMAAAVGLLVLLWGLATAGLYRAAFSTGELKQAITRTVH